MVAANEQHTWRTQKKARNRKKVPSADEHFQELAKDKHESNKNIFNPYEHHDAEQYNGAFDSLLSDEKKDMIRRAKRLISLIKANDPLRICTDKGTARIAFKGSALTQYGEIWPYNAPEPMQPIIPTAANASSSVDIGQPPPLLHDPYAKGKRSLEDGGRGQVLKAPKVESGTDRNKEKSKPSSAFFPRFRE
jgi:hypothetical protein